ncbi:MAG: TonB-dependent receptor [Saprospiraceae bacterium]
MKKIYYTIILLFLVPTLSQAQPKKDIIVKGFYEDRLLDLVIMDLEIKHRLTFEYEKTDIKNVRITARVDRIPLHSAMKIILHNTDLDFSIDGKTVKLFPKEEQTYEAVDVEPIRSDFKITGIIQDVESGESLPFATVLVKDAANGTTTNVDGYFTVFNVSSDTSILRVQYLGYQTVNFRLLPDMNFERLIIKMRPMNQQLQEVLVLGEKEDQLIKASTGISKVGLTPKTIAILPSLGEKDVFRSLQMLPGVSGTSDNSSGLYVRGGTPDQNLVLFDGFTVYHVDHLFGFFSAFNPNAMKDVQLYKGGFPAKFGGRLSSVVDLTGKDGNTENFNVGFGASLLSVNGFVESPFADGKGSILVAGRRSFQSGFYNSIFENLIGTDNLTNEVQGGRQGGGRFVQAETQPNSYFYDLNAKITYRPNKKDILSLSFYNGQDDLDNSRYSDNSTLPAFLQNDGSEFRNNVTDITAWGNFGASAKWSRKWSDKFYSNINGSFSNYYNNRNRSTDIYFARDTFVREIKRGTVENNNIFDYSFKWDNEWKITPNNQLDFGVQTTYNDISYSLIQDDTTTILDRTEQGLNAAFYVQDRITISDKLILQGGLRTVYYDLSDNVYFEPRASLIFEATKNIKLKGAWGKYNQFVTRVTREDIQQGSRDLWLLSDGETLPISSSTHYIAGASYETPTYLFDVEAYYKPLSGISEYTTRLVLEGRGPNAELNYEELFFEGTGLAKGIEFLAQKKVGDFTGWASYTLGSVRHNFEVYGEDNFPALHDQTHELKLVAAYQYKKFTFAGTFVYGTGKPYTAPTGYYELELPDGTSSDFWVISDKNALRLPDYHRLDLSATYNFRIGQTKADLGLSLFNLYNRKNIWYKEFDVLDGELLETDVLLQSFTPSLFFTWTLK